MVMSNMFSKQAQHSPNTSTLFPKVLFPLQMCVVWLWGGCDDSTCWRHLDFTYRPSTTLPHVSPHALPLSSDLVADAISPKRASRLIPPFVQVICANCWFTSPTAILLMLSRQSSIKWLKIINVRSILSGFLLSGLLATMTCDKKKHPLAITHWLLTQNHIVANIIISD